MALKNMIKVGDKVSFGRGAESRSGTVVKTNPKTARIRVTGDGLFDVTYNLIRKGPTRVGSAMLAHKMRTSNPASEHYHVGAQGFQAGANASRARKAAAAKEPTRAAKKPRQKATGRKICAVPVAVRQCATEKFKKNPAKKGRAASVGTRNGLKWVAEIVDPGGPSDGLYAAFYSMEELNIMTGRKFPGKQVDIFRMDNGKYYKSIRIPRSGPQGRAKIEADKKKRRR